MTDLRLTSVLSYKKDNEVFEVPVDEIVAVGAGFTAAAAAGAAMLTALKQLELMRSETREMTPQDRLNQMMLFMDKLGPEAQAKALETALPSIVELIGLAGG